MTEEPKTPDQPGTEAPKGDPSADVMERLTQLEGKLESESEARILAEGAAVKSEDKAKKLQASRDRVQSRLDKMQQKTLQVGRAVPAGAAPGQEQVDLREFANEQARDALMLRKLMEYGLTEDDLPADVEYSTPGELDTALRVIVIDKRTAEQDQRLPDEPVEPTLEPATSEPIVASEAIVDTGGPTGIAPATEPSSPEALLERAQELKDKGDPASLEQARWLALQANYGDDSKIVGRGRGGPSGG